MTKPKCLHLQPPLPRAFQERISLRRGKYSGPDRFESCNHFNRRPGPAKTIPLPGPLARLLRDLATMAPRRLLAVSLLRQTLREWEISPGPDGRYQAPGALLTTRGPLLRLSSSRFGAGQTEGSFRTPLGLHRIARKIGGGLPVGTVFRHRQPVGYVWEGLAHAAICHRILWLEGLQEGHNRGGRRDTFRRYIYIHGFADETTLGRPQSRGCLHLAANDLIPLFDRVPVGTLVWIAP